MSVRDLLDRLPASDRRVERATRSEINRAVRERTDAAIAALEGADERRFAQRLCELEREWDVERVLQTNAATLAFVGTILGARVDRRFLLLPATVFTFLAQHAVQGWCPPLPVLRALGVRTVHEIERERHALKALRGDYDSVPDDSVAPSERVRAVLAAVDA